MMRCTPYCIRLLDQACVEGEHRGPVKTTQVALMKPGSSVCNAVSFSANEGYQLSSTNADILRNALDGRL